MQNINEVTKYSVALMPGIIYGCDSFQCHL